jgi:tetratricopeptide (TPR) repeat protein
MIKKIILGVVIALLIAGGAAFVVYKKPWSGTKITGVKVEQPVGIRETDKKLFDEAAAVLAQNSGDFEAWMTVGRVRGHVSDFTGAIEAYEKASAIKPVDIVPFFNRGDAYISLKNYDKAAEMYDKVIELNPKWVNAYHEAFTLYQFKLTTYFDGKMENLLKSGLEKSKDLGGKGVADFYTLLGMYYKINNQKSLAIENLEKGLELDPTNDGIKSELKDLK